ncbi:hypothetical protein [Ochrobactrum sp. CGA5]|nr:hypothetical protein [Ochrobactrum sp. CGA5]
MTHSNNQKSEFQVAKQMEAISEALRNPYQVIPDSIVEEMVNELKTADVG